VVPKLKSTPKVLGLVSDPSLNRDSLGSTTVAGRTLWTARDTQLFNPDGHLQKFPVYASTASWSNLIPEGGPLLTPLPPGGDELHSTVLELYGRNSLDQNEPYFPYSTTNESCTAPAGSCPDESRYALWPDLPPLVTSIQDNRVTAYTWIRKFHIQPDLSVLYPNPATLLYRLDFESDSSDTTSLPKVTTVDSDFWDIDEIPYGDYGNFVHDGTAYLYAQANGSTSLARVPASQIETKSAYEYWVNGSWTSQRPTIDSDGINISNCNAGGQGTYYYSKPWNSFVWIGGDRGVSAEVYVTTAPDPTGPWIEPIHLYTGINGNYFLASYSIQAHPGLTSDLTNAIYITYTKNDLDKDGNNLYSTPLVLFEWE
ncbi:hypothetical protein EJ05DRAFT_429524, partial [Pseudovirgaria hyperparasitica]